ncbi:cytochrome c-type biogenesis protein [Geminicoccus roseus]|uniref:cytochrome c-type biogenesis protein n=1 Tax=Geminicoccus roseus TaxID=404900 RepID=UPI0003F6C525|nr:cytochrome c-type biogenesis protein [Geminicoccus roseus]
MTGALRTLLLAILVALASLGLPGPAPAAISPAEQLADPAQEARARALGQELRCLVCQNQSIDDSDADLAKDLRRVVRERIEAGDSDREILDYLTDRYGEFVLLRPPVSRATWVLWFGPLVLLVVAVLTALVWRRRQVATAELGWTESEQIRLDQALSEMEGEVTPRTEPRARS